MTKVKNPKTENSPLKYMEDCLIEVFEDRRGVLISYMKQRLSEVMSGELSKSVGKKSNGREWEGIDSLSKLRGIVGGRFENLKNRWLAAGFPLKQDKASKVGDFSVDEKGWIELSSWISNQGFEVRLNPEKKDVVFEIKSLN